VQDELVDKGRKFLELVTRAEFAAAVEDFDATMQEKMPAGQLEKVWGTVTRQAGGFQELTGTRQESAGGFTSVFLTCRFEKTMLDVRVVFDAKGRITGLWFVPPRTQPENRPPAYADTTRFREQDAAVECGEWKLPATLALPEGEGPHPGLVLVHGSGPNDRDETIGPNKPFRDLAWGLASRGIAVLRYEKRTRVYRSAFLDPAKGFTVKEESVDDALAAAALLRRTPGIAPDRVFVLGHSLGGMLIPRIGRLDPEAAGFIILAGATRKGEEAIIKQMEYIVSLDGSISEDESDRLRAYRNTAARIKELRPEDLGSEEVLFGAYAAYWLDLRDYDPPLSARDLKRPLLILQGERDYQVTTEDYDNWKTGLGGVPGVVFKLYPSLNHLFMPGRGKSRPAEYQRQGNVSEEVVEDIAAWIKTGHVQETQ
jgi:dienelactone hydrolase